MYKLRFMVFISAAFAQKIIQSYYAAVTYVDDLIGMLLNQLYSSKLRENTIIILTSDHGIHTY